MKRKSNWNIIVEKESRQSVSAPPGFDFKKEKKDKSDKDEKNDEQEEIPPQGDILTKKAWDIAKSPIKQVVMYGIVGFISGRGIGIIPLIMLGVQFYQGISGVLKTNAIFRDYKNAEGGVFVQKLLYFFLQLCVIGVGMFRLNRMGLLPSYSDWVSNDVAYWENVSGGNVG